LTTDISEMLKQTSLSLCWLNPKICYFLYNFHFELFSWFIFLAECKILNFADVGKHTCTASLHEWPLAHYQSNGLILLVISFF